MLRARLLDLTRLVSRLGRGPLTGIDRVELAYLTRFLADEAPFFALVRSAAGFLLLDRPGCVDLLALIVGQARLPRADLLSHLMHRRDPLRARSETAARKLAVGRGPRFGLRRLLRRLPNGACYYNVGHSNLTARGLAQIRAAGLDVVVMIHDTIPLDHPEFARPDIVDRFRRKLAAVGANASRVIHLTKATRATTETQMARLGRVPPGVVAALGVEVAEPDIGTLPPDLDLSEPYFVTLGTIEPRKNHQLLLDVWAQMAEPAPKLYILGGRGWALPALLSRLDALPPSGPIRELPGLSDAAVAALMGRAVALLAPSRAEGFGLPPVEAATLGRPIIATDLPVTRELLGNKAVYLPPDDIYSWLETIVRQLETPALGQMSDGPPIRMTWADHFNVVLRDG